MGVLLKILEENSEALDNLQFIPIQVGVLTNVVGALGEVARIQRNRAIINDKNKLGLLIRLIGTNQ